MFFHIAFDYTPEQRDKVQERFKQTGAPPPGGVAMTGHWRGRKQGLPDCRIVGC